MNVRLVVVGLVCAVSVPVQAGQSSTARDARPPRAGTLRTLTLEDRVAAQRKIEAVYWRHRIWPKDNSDHKPSLDALMPAPAMRAKVLDDLRKSSALELLWHHPITGAQLQAELDRMARGSRDPATLRELFDALGNDAELVAETLARPVLADRLLRSWYAGDERSHSEVGAPRAESFDVWWSAEKTRIPIDIQSDATPLTLPALPPTACANDTWQATSTDIPDRRAGHTAIWTGSEMIVWGGSSSGYYLNTGGRYNPATDTWAPTSTGSGALDSRSGHTAVWTGTEMIVWGGLHQDLSTGTIITVATGSRYDPSTDSWTPVSTGTNAASPRWGHSAVWTGTEMIVWGGLGPGYPYNGGARYRPSSDSWAPVSNVNAPVLVFGPAAVWTGSLMLIWGGSPDSPGGRYDPIADSWTTISRGPSASSPRSGHSLVWTGAEMIVWGGREQASGQIVSTGGRYDPVSDTWKPTSASTTPSAFHTAVWTGSAMIVAGGSGGGTTAAEYDPASDSWVTTSPNPVAARNFHTAVWTGTEMIVWGGRDRSDFGGAGLNTGARFDPTTDTWVATSSGASVPSERLLHTAVWTGSEMIVWGGQPRAVPSPFLNTGGRYAPATDSWVPTSVGDGVPEPRHHHSAVWTGREMIIWGGETSSGVKLNTGGRYDPSSDTWHPTSTAEGVPPPAERQATVWSGTEMIVWGPGSTTAGGRYDPGADSWRPMAPGPSMNPAEPNVPAVWTGTEMILWQGNPFSGGRYNPRTDAWSPISPSPSMPTTRFEFTVTWTGTEMIVWGGCCPTNTGGRYNPATDSWMPTSTGGNVPSAREVASGVWTGSEMIIWGGAPPGGSIYPINSGGRYDPSTDSWSPISSGPNFPSSRFFHTAVWTGTEMIVWGGDPGTATGGRYCARVNHSPAADAGPDQVLECSGALSATARLDGSKSSDPDSSPGTNDDIVSYAWAEGTHPLASGEVATVPLPLGPHTVALTVTDGAGATGTDDTLVTVQDTKPPVGEIVAPAAKACFGPTALPVTVTDDVTDVCDPTVLRSYDPAPGPSYSAHGDYHVTLTAKDTSGNAATAGVEFTIDTKPPLVQLLAPADRAILLPGSAGFSIVFHDSDDDGATGNVVHEVVKLQGCTIYDGLTYGNRDGLLSDETLNVSETELCRLAALCGFTTLSQPELRVEATDCGGNVGSASHHFAGSLALRPGICGS